MKFLKTIKEIIQTYLTKGQGLETIKVDEVVKEYEGWLWRFINGERLTKTFFNSLKTN